MAERTRAAQIIEGALDDSVSQAASRRWKTHAASAPPSARPAGSARPADIAPSMLGASSHVKSKQRAWRSVSSELGCSVKKYGLCAVFVFVFALACFSQMDVAVFHKNTKEGKKKNMGSIVVVAAVVAATFVAVPAIVGVCKPQI